MYDDTYDVFKGNADLYIQDLCNRDGDLSGEKNGNNNDNNYNIEQRDIAEKHVNDKKIQDDREFLCDDTKDLFKSDGDLSGTNEGNINDNKTVQENYNIAERVIDGAISGKVNWKEHDQMHDKIFPDTDDIR